MESRIYSRKFLRIRPDAPLYGTAKIISIGNRPVSTGTACIRIKDISCGGLRFVSMLKLPVDESVILQVAVNLNEMKFCLQGFIVHCSGSKAGEFEYGFRFLKPDFNLREMLKKKYCRIFALHGLNLFILHLS